MAPRTPHPPHQSLRRKHSFSMYCARQKRPSPSSSRMMPQAFHCICRLLCPWCILQLYNVRGDGCGSHSVRFFLATCGPDTEALIIAVDIEIFGVRCHTCYETLSRIFVVLSNHDTARIGEDILRYNPMVSYHLSLDYTFRVV
jgi:hypothetical protein